LHGALELAHGILVVVEMMMFMVVCGGFCRVRQSAAAAVACGAFKLPDPDMSLTMHSCSVPIFVRMLGNLLNWLDKAEAHAARQFDSVNYLGLRLAPTCCPSAPIQIATTAPRLRGPAGRVEVRSGRKRGTVASARACAQDHAMLPVLCAEQIDGSGGRGGVLPMRQGTVGTRRGLLKHSCCHFFFTSPRLCTAAPRRRGAGQRDFWGG